MMKAIGQHDLVGDVVDYAETHLRRFFSLVLCMLCLSGCMTSMQKFTDACATYGFLPGTDVFAGCVEREVAREREAWNTVAVHLHASQPPQQPPASLHCETTPLGRSMMTHCW